MTWSRVAPSSSYVLAHRGGADNDKVRIGINSSNWVELDPADAASLGEYLIEKSKEIENA